MSSFSLNTFTLSLLHIIIQARYSQSSHGKSSKIRFIHPLLFLRANQRTAYIFPHRLQFNGCQPLSHSTPLVSDSQSAVVWEHTMG